MSKEIIVAVVNQTTGLVENIAIIADGDSSKAPDGMLFVPSDAAAIGDSWDGKQIVKAPAPPADVLPGSGGTVANKPPVSRSEFDGLVARVLTLEIKIF